MGLAGVAVSIAGWAAAGALGCGDGVIDLLPASPGASVAAPAPVSLGSDCPDAAPAAASAPGAAPPPPPMATMSMKPMPMPMPGDASCGDACATTEAPCTAVTAK
jgi:hypothetical protein